MAGSNALGFLKPFPHFATHAIHTGQKPEQWRSWAVVPPITLSTIFKQRMPGDEEEYKYTRFGNPNRHVLEKVVSALDGAQYCLAYSSGVAAILNICHLLKTGDTIICMDEVYEGTRELFDKVKEEFNLEVVYVDCRDPKKLKTAIEEHPSTKLVWLESPTNPVLTVIDIKACAEVAHRHPGVLVAVDNSFMSPYFQRPLALGADICMSSATKYINGHSDVLLGLVSVNKDDLYKRLNYLQKTLGAVPSPFDCYMCNRGLKTLHIRMKRHFHNGLAVAKYLESHPRVEKVIYPGLSSHPQYEVMKRQCTGVSGMVSFYINGNKRNAIAFLEKLEVFTLGFSLGGFESLAEHPYTMTHNNMPDNVKERLGITDTLIRLSVGLEDEVDLITDLKQALEDAASMRTDERKRNSLAWTHREEQNQSHSSHEPCALFPGSMANPRAAFGEGFHPSSQLPADFCSTLGQEMGSLDSEFLDAAIQDCTTNTCLRREVPQEVTWSCSCFFPDTWLLDLGFLWLLLGCAVLSLCSGFVSLGAGLCAACGGGELPLSFPPSLRGQE